MKYFQNRTDHKLKVPLKITSNRSGKLFQVEDSAERRDSGRRPVARRGGRRRGGGAPSQVSKIFQNAFLKL